MLKEHHLKDDVHRLHIKIKEGSRGLISIKQCVENAMDYYVQNSQERLISAAWRSSGEQEVIEHTKITKQRKQSRRKQDSKNKRHHGQVIRDSEDIAEIK